MLKFITSGLLALGLATGASAQGLSFSGGEFSAADNIYTNGVTTLDLYSVSGSAAFDWTGTPWEVQADVSYMSLTAGTNLTTARVTAGYQAGQNTKFGIYGGILSTPASPQITSYGAVAMINTGGDNYLDLDFGALNVSGNNVTYGGARYSMGGFFAQAVFVQSPAPVSLSNVSVGYEYTFANNMRISAMVGSTNSSIFPTSITTAQAIFSIPFGGANSGGSDARLFWDANIFDTFPSL